MKFPVKSDPFRIILSYALVDVSDINLKSQEEAYKVMAAVPSAIVQRVFKIYKGSFPATRKFITANVYKAPEPVDYARRIVEEEEEIDQVVDKVEQDMVDKFGRREIDDARAVERQIVQGAKKNEGYRGAVRING